jgi:hypothetical protein
MARSLTPTLARLSANEADNPYIRPSPHPGPVAPAAA